MRTSTRVPVGRSFDAFEGGRYIAAFRLWSVVPPTCSSTRCLRSAEPRKQAATPRSGRSRDNRRPVRDSLKLLDDESKPASRVEVTRLPMESVGVDVARASRGARSSVRSMSRRIASRGLPPSLSRTIILRRLGRLPCSHAPVSARSWLCGTERLCARPALPRLLQDNTRNQMLVC